MQIFSFSEHCSEHSVSSSCPPQSDLDSRVQAFLCCREQSQLFGALGDLLAAEAPLELLIGLFPGGLKSNHLSKPQLQSSLGNFPSASNHS